MGASPATQGTVGGTKPQLEPGDRKDWVLVGTFVKEEAVSLGQRVGIFFRTFFGIVVGLLLGWLVFLWSLIRGKRAVHAEGILCTAELVPVGEDALSRAIATRFTGPALVRFSGAFQHEGSKKKEPLGLALRMRLPRDEDGTPEAGDQDLVFGTFESFRTLIFGKDKEKVNVEDYLANEYDTVAPWRLGDVGVVRLRIMPTNKPPSNRQVRLERLEDDIRRQTATLLLGYHPNDGEKGPVSPLAMLHLKSISPLPAQQLRVSFRRTGRGVKAVGFRNGLRRVMYPFGEAGRRLRGG